MQEVNHIFGDEILLSGNTIHKLLQIVMSVQRLELLEILAERFDQEELRTLCFYLGIDYDAVKGEGKEGKARELIAYLDRRNKIPSLIEVGQQLRPDIPWKSGQPVSFDSPKKARVPEVVDDASDVQSVWHSTLLTAAILIVFASVGWFLHEPTFEPLIGVIAGIAGLIAYKREVNRVFDSALALFLMILFIAGVITIASSQTNDQDSPLQVINRWATFAVVIGIAAFVIRILNWSVQNAESSQLARLVAWSLVGKADEQVIEAVLFYLSRLVMTMITWAVLVSSIWIISVLGITAIAFVFGSEISGTWTTVQNYAVFGLIVGAILGVIISLYRFHQQNISLNHKS